MAPSPPPQGLPEARDGDVPRAVPPGAPSRAGAAVSCGDVGAGAPVPISSNEGWQPGWWGEHGNRRGAADSGEGMRCGLGWPMAAAPARLPGPRCYISCPTSLQHSPLSLGPAVCRGVDTLHNTPRSRSPSPSRLPGCWKAELSQQPAGSRQGKEDAPSTPASSRAPEEVVGPRRVPKDLLKPAGRSCSGETVVGEGGLPHKRGGEALPPLPQRACGAAPAGVREPPRPVPEGPEVNPPAEPGIKPDGRVGSSFQRCLSWMGLVLQRSPREKHPRRLFRMPGNKLFLTPQQGGRGGKL